MCALFNQGYSAGRYMKPKAQYHGNIARLVNLTRLSLNALHAKSYKFNQLDLIRNIPYPRLQITLI